MRIHTLMMLGALAAVGCGTSPGAGPGEEPPGEDVETRSDAGPGAPSEEALRSADSLAEVVRSDTPPPALAAYAGAIEAAFTEEEVAELLSRDWVETPFEEHLTDSLVSRFLEFSMGYFDDHPEIVALMGRETRAVSLFHPECVEGVAELGSATAALVRAIAGTGLGGTVLYGVCISIGPASVGLCAAALGFYIGLVLDELGPAGMSFLEKLRALDELCAQECGEEGLPCCWDPIGDGCGAGLTCGIDELCEFAETCDSVGDSCCADDTCEGALVCDLGRDQCVECPASECDPAADEVRCTASGIDYCMETTCGAGQWLTRADVRCCDADGDGLIIECGVGAACLRMGTEEICGGEGDFECDGNGDGSFILCADASTYECAERDGDDVCREIGTFFCDGNGDGAYTSCDAETETCLLVNGRDTCAPMGSTPCDGNLDGNAQRFCAEGEECRSVRGDDTCVTPEQLYCDANGDGDGLICGDGAGPYCVRSGTTEACVWTDRIGCDANEDGVYGTCPADQQCIPTICGRVSCVSSVEKVHVDSCMPNDGSYLCDANGDGFYAVNCPADYACVTATLQYGLYSHRRYGWSGYEDACLAPEYADYVPCDGNGDGVHEAICPPTYDCDVTPTGLDVCYY